MSQSQSSVSTHCKIDKKNSLSPSNALQYCFSSGFTTQLFLPVLFSFHCCDWDVVRRGYGEGGRGTWDYWFTKGCKGTLWAVTPAKDRARLKGDSGPPYESNRWFYFIRTHLPLNYCFLYLRHLSRLCTQSALDPEPNAIEDSYFCAGILEQSMEARNRVGIGLSLSCRPARLHRLAESIPWNRFLGFLKV